MSQGREVVITCISCHKLIIKCTMLLMYYIQVLIIVFFALVIEVRKYCVCSIGEIAMRVIESNLIYFLTNMNNQLNMI